MSFLHRRLLPLLFSTAFALFVPHVASAATMYLTADKAGGLIGDTVRVTLVLDSEGVSVNAVQGDLNFVPDSVEPVGIDSSDSILTFWLQDPTFDVNAGKLSFIGGSTSGQTGRSLMVVHASFKIKRSGKIPFNVTNAAVTASDGSGTNVLTDIRNLEILGLAQSTTQPAAVMPEVVPPPVQIIRKPVPSPVLPVAPELSVTLYPDPTRWYNVQSNFLASWPLPLDVAALATVVDQIPTTEPKKSEGLFDNKYFKALPEGISFLHVRFKNNVGWGPTTHYRLAVDTIPPSPFSLVSQENFSTDTPNPTLQLNSSDQLSGLLNYTVQVDLGAVETTSGTTFQLPILAPGEHHVDVTAYDLAGNKTQSSATLTIIPIESPFIGSISPVVYVGEGGVQIVGTALPHSTVLLQLKTASGQFINLSSTNVDENGKWTALIDYPLLKGNYFIEAVTRDARGARSQATISSQFRVSDRPFFTVFGFEVGYLNFFIPLLAILVVLLIWENVRQARQKAALVCPPEIKPKRPIIKKS